MEVIQFAIDRWDSLARGYFFFGFAAGCVFSIIVIWIVDKWLS